MSKTTNTSEKARPETLSKRATSSNNKENKENKGKKTEKKPSVSSVSSASSKKQTVDQASIAPSTREVRDSAGKKTARRKSTAEGKSASAVSERTLTATAQVSYYEDAPSQLLRRTKTTASALAQLEKGIEFIHRKDFKKAFSELQSLIEKYPSETEIAARAHSYLDICRRSEARQKKPAAATHNQIYALGVLEHNKADYDKAIAYFRQSLEKYPRADYIYYSIAASAALKGDVSEAIENLRKAVELNIDSRVHAKNDPDFTVLESNKEFLELIGVSAPRKMRL